MIPRHLMLPERHFVTQGFADALRLTICHPVGFRALTEQVVQFQEVDDLFPAIGELGIEAVSCNSHHFSIGGKPVGQGLRAQLDEYER